MIRLLSLGLTLCIASVILVVYGLKYGSHSAVVAAFAVGVLGGAATSAAWRP